MKLFILAILLVFIVSCGGSGGSSSGGGSAPAPAPQPQLLNNCQVCTSNAQCSSGNCIPFQSGYKRCAPVGTQAGYPCPGGYYKDREDTCS